VISALGNSKLAAGSIVNETAEVHLEERLEL
jgi:hypothetical protein